MQRRSFLASIAGLAASSHSNLYGGSDPAEADKRARTIHRASPVVVIHDHRPITADIPLMKAGGVTAKVYQIGVDVEIGPDFRASGAVRQGWARRSRAALEEAKEEIAAHPNDLILALTGDDILRAKKEGKIAIMLGVEGAKLLEGDLENLRLFHRLGLRELQLRWAVPNQIVERDTLTEFGRSVIREAQKLGMIVDLTHIPDTAFFEAVALSTRPLIVSHGIGKKDFGERRLKALAGTGGVLGMHFYSSYLGNQPSVGRLLDAIDEVKGVVGTDPIGLGVDLFPTDGPWRAFQNAQGTTDVSWAIPDLSHMEKVTEGLARRNYTDPQIAGILGGNFLRVCRANLGK